MTTEPLARRGFRAARSYDRGRPGYAPGAVAAVMAAFGLGPASRVLDLAAGTGQVSRAFAPLVGSVVAVEPSEQMREVLAERLPGIEIRAGEAERLPLGDGEVDAIVVGSAFHWFAREPALAEMARVLRPGGGLALLWNYAVAVEPELPDELERLLTAHRESAVPEAERYETGAWRRALEGTELFEPLVEPRPPEHEQRQDREGLVSQIASWSYIAAMPDAQRQEVLDEVRRLTPDEIRITLRTDVFWTRRR